MTPTERIFNFSAGPAVLPLPVLEEAREHLLALPGVGMSILEISHRSKPFEEICFGAEADLRKLAGIPDGYQVLFLQGGATLQFSMVPMNLLPAGGTADYLVTGVWSEKAIKEAKKLGDGARRRELEGDQPRPDPGRRPRSRYSPSPAYVHMTSNNTIYGTQWHREPDGPGGRAAGHRRLVRHLLPPDRRLEVRADLRRRAEEPAIAGRDAGRSSATTCSAGRPRRCRLPASTAPTPRRTRSTTRRRCSRSTCCTWC